MFCWPCCVILAGMALYVRLLVYAGLSLFIICGLYVYMVVCVVYAYNLTISSWRFYLQLILDFKYTLKQSGYGPRNLVLI